MDTEMTRDEFISSKVWPDKCWHDLKKVVRYDEYLCSKCNRVYESNPDFSSESGFFMLLKGMRECMRWDEFSVVIGGRISIAGEPCHWTHSKYINPPVFADAVGKFFGWEE